MAMFAFKICDPCDDSVSSDVPKWFYLQVVLRSTWVMQFYFIIYKHHVVYSVGAQEGVVITLDGAQATFISPEKLVFSLKGGEM